MESLFRNDSYPENLNEFKCKLTAPSKYFNLGDTVLLPGSPPASDPTARNVYQSEFSGKSALWTLKEGEWQVIDSSLTYVGKYHEEKKERPTPYSKSLQNKIIRPIALRQAPLPFPKREEFEHKNKKVVNIIKYLYRKDSTEEEYAQDILRRTVSMLFAYRKKPQVAKGMVEATTFFYGGVIPQDAIEKVKESSKNSLARYSKCGDSIPDETLKKVLVASKLFKFDISEIILAMKKEVSLCKENLDKFYNSFSNISEEMSAYIQKK
jgi:hypothetical protein